MTENEALTLKALKLARERADKMETALRELVGFAERNSKRAEAAWRAAEKELKENGRYPYITSGTPEETSLAATSRWHEANRFLSVVRDRVREALS